jgi:hypothetical protein
MSVPSLVRPALLAGLAFFAPQGEGREARALYERGEWAAALEACRDRLVASADDAGALALAGQILRDPRHVTSPTSERVMAVLAEHPALGKTSVVPAGEPCERLVLRGTVRDAHGAPLAGARLHIFQTDKDGHYTPAKVMDEPGKNPIVTLTRDGQGVQRGELEIVLEKP